MKFTGEMATQIAVGSGIDLLLAGEHPEHVRLRLVRAREQGRRWGADGYAMVLLCALMVRKQAEA